MKINILSIDQGSNCGWAVSRSIYGVWDLRTRKDESQGMKLLRFRAKLEEVCSLQKIDLIVYERVAGFHKSSIIHAAKLVAVVESFCEKMNISYRAYSATEIKKFATSKGNCSKQAMIDAAKEKLGYSGDSDDEADAMWLLELALHDLKLGD